MNNIARKYSFLIVGLAIAGSTPAQAVGVSGPLMDGTYDAQVTTSSGTYTVPVEVESGEVTHVSWPNGGNMSVSGADIDAFGEASGYNSKGDTVDIEIEQ